MTALTLVKVMAAAKVEALITGMEMEEMKRVQVKGKGKDRDINPKIELLKTIVRYRKNVGKTF